MGRRTCDMGSTPFLRRERGEDVPPEEQDAFARWMQEIEDNVELLTGLDPNELPDLPYADWFTKGVGSDEATQSIMERLNREE